MTRGRTSDRIYAILTRLLVAPAALAFLGALAVCGGVTSLPREATVTPAPTESLSTTSPTVPPTARKEAELAQPPVDEAQIKVNSVADPAKILGSETSLFLNPVPVLNYWLKSQPILPSREEY